MKAPLKLSRDERKDLRELLATLGARILDNPHNDPMFEHRIQEVYVYPRQIRLAKALAARMD